MGSIVGTFATGFVLIAWFGTHTIVWGVAALLLALGVFFLLGGRWRSALLVAVILAGGWGVSSSREWLKGSCLRETNYFCIKITEEEREGDTVRLLVLDHLVHSYSSLKNPTRLVYGYEQMYAEMAAYRAQRNDHLRALMIGGGGYTFPRYMEAVYPHSDIHVVEIDPGVTQVAYDMLGLGRDTKIVTHNQDARLFLAQEPTLVYDLILGDAFNHFSVPYHLTTKEFNDRVQAWLAKDGLYVVNILDGPQGDLVRALVHTLRQTFLYVYLVPGVDSWREASRSTFVLIASDTPLDLSALETTDGGDGYALVARQIYTQEEVEVLLAEARAVVLTDQYAPVDQMLAVVFREESPK